MLYVLMCFIYSEGYSVVAKKCEFRRFKVPEFFKVVSLKFLLDKIARNDTCLLVRGIIFLRSNMCEVHLKYMRSTRELFCLFFYALLETTFSVLKKRVCITNI